MNLQETLEQRDHSGGLALALVICDDGALAAHPRGAKPVEGGKLRRVQGGAAHKRWLLLQVPLGRDSKEGNRKGSGGQGRFVSFWYFWLLLVGRVNQAHLPGDKETLSPSQLEMQA